MQLKTILHHVERHKSFVSQAARWSDRETKTAIEIPIEPRAIGRAICSGCGQAASGYDRLAERRFEFVPLWGREVGGRRGEVGGKCDGGDDARSFPGPWPLTPES